MKKKDTKTRIVETAYSLFHQYNYQSVTIMDICNACQITKPTFYKYIDSKDSLLEYYFREMTNELPSGWFEVDESKNCFDQLLEKFEYYYHNIDGMGFKLYREVIISNFKEELGSYKDSREFNQCIENLICIAQKKGDPESVGSSSSYERDDGIIGRDWRLPVHARKRRELFEFFRKGIEALLEPVREEVCAST